MPDVPLSTPQGGPVVPYATVDDVRNLLGQLGSRLPGWVDLDAFLGIAHATTVDVLAGVYPEGIPDFTGNALAVVRHAEARYAAADVLNALRVSVPEIGDTPDRLVGAADAALRDGVVGHPVGASGDGGGTGTPTGPGPLVSSFTPVSAFDDPYDPARGSMPGEYRG